MPTIKKEEPQVSIADLISYNKQQGLTDHEAFLQTSASYLPTSMDSINSGFDAYQTLRDSYMNMLGEICAVANDYDFKEIIDDIDEVKELHLCSPKYLENIKSSLLNLQLHKTKKEDLLKALKNIDAFLKPDQRVQGDEMLQTFLGGMLAFLLTNEEIHGEEASSQRQAFFFANYMFGTTISEVEKYHKRISDFDKKHPDDFKFLAEVLLIILFAKLKAEEKTFDELMALSDKRKKHARARNEFKKTFSAYVRMKQGFTFQKLELVKDYLETKPKSFNVLFNKDAQKRILKVTSPWDETYSPSVYVYLSLIHFAKKHFPSFLEKFESQLKQ